VAITSNVTSTNAVLSGLLPVYFEKRMLPRLYANLQFYRLGQIRSIPRNQGKTIVFNRPVKFGAKTTALTEGATPAQSNASSEIVSGTVKQYGDWVSKSDFADMTLLDLDWMAEEFEYSARLTIDQLIRNELRASASALGSNAGLLDTRLDFTADLTNALGTGAAKLINADLNEQAAKLVSLRVAGQLGVIGLNIAQQGQRAVLQLF